MIITVPAGRNSTNQYFVRGNYDILADTRCRVAGQGFFFHYPA